MQCPKCYANNQDGARFCTECGASLTEPVQPTMQPPAQQQPHYAQPPIQPPVQQPYAPPQPQQSYAQPQQPYTMSNGGATPPPAPKKKKTGVVLAVILAALVVLIAGVFVAVKLYSAETVPSAPSQTELSSEELGTTLPAPDGAATTVPAETTEPMNGTAENDFSILYGEWVDQGGRYDLYVRPDGAFILGAPDGTFTGEVERTVDSYRLKADGAPASLKNAAIAVDADAGEQVLRLKAGDAIVTLDFLHFPEKSEMFDWIVIDDSSNMIEYYDAYDECRVDKSEYSTELMMVANYPLRDVKYLALELVDVPQDGNPVFKTKELYSQPALMNRRPLVFDMTNAGDLPTRGVSFVGIDGETYCFSISFSGYDGSVLYAEFDPY